MAGPNNKEKKTGRSWSSRALGPSFLGLPVVVAGAGFLVAVGSWRHAEALGAALVAEEEARLLVVRLGASPPALPAALCTQFIALAFSSFQSKLFEKKKKPIQTELYIDYS